MHPQVADECGLQMDLRFGTCNARSLCMSVLLKTIVISIVISLRGGRSGGRIPTGSLYSQCICCTDLNSVL